MSQTQILSNSCLLNCLSASEQEIEAQVEKYLLSVKRSETNAKIVEALLA